MSQIQLIAIDQIRRDGGTQFRPNINQDLVKRYKELMLDDAVFPPVEVMFDGKNYWLWDGFHRYFVIKELNLKTLECNVTLGTQYDAIRAARKANGSHGASRDYETLCNVVRSALEDANFADKSNREIARECHVSHTFVASVKDPSKKTAARAKKAVQQQVESAPVEVDTPASVESAPERPSLTQDYGPSSEELEANERAEQADRDLIAKMLDSDDTLKTLHEELTRLNYLVAQKDTRIASLMNEKNTAVKMVKDLQRRVDKYNKAKK